MSYKNKMQQLQLMNEAEKTNAFDQAIVNLIKENEMLKRQMNLMNVTNQKDQKKQEGRNQQPTNREKVKSKITPKKCGGGLKMKRI